MLPCSSPREAKNELAGVVQVLGSFIPAQSSTQRSIHHIHGCCSTPRPPLCPSLLMVWKDFLRDVDNLFPFLIEFIKPGNKPSLHGQAAGASLAGLLAGSTVFIPATVCCDREISLLKEGSPFFPPHPSSLSKEQTKAVAGVDASPLINLLVSAMYQVWK